MYHVSYANCLTSIPLLHITERPFPNRSNLDVTPLSTRFHSELSTEHAQDMHFSSKEAHVGIRCEKYVIGGCESPAKEGMHAVITYDLHRGSDSVIILYRADLSDHARIVHI